MYLKDHQMRLYKPRKTKEYKDLEEITFAIALLGGILAILLKVIDYFNNFPLEAESISKPVVFVLISFLLTELSIIFLFLFSKGFQCM
ncbi:MAG: hypothetical protein WA130_12450 [Candidatus Methanoperedens sp.]